MKNDLTNEQKKIIDENHSLILDFMKTNQLDNEFYDWLAIALIEAVAEYNPDKIRDIKGFIIFKFKRAMHHYYEYVYALKRKAFQERISLLDFVDYSGDSDFTKQVENKMILDEFLHGDITSQIEKKYLQYLMYGIYPTEIAELTGENFLLVRSRIAAMRKKLRDYYYLGIVPKSIFVPHYMVYIFCPVCKSFRIRQKGFEETQKGGNARFECSACFKNFNVPLAILNNKDQTAFYLQRYFPEYMEFVFCPFCQGFHIKRVGKQKGYQKNKQGFLCSD